MPVKEGKRPISVHIVLLPLIDLGEFVVITHHRLTVKSCELENVQLHEKKNFNSC